MVREETERCRDDGGINCERARRIAKQVEQDVSAETSNLYKHYYYDASLQATLYSKSDTFFSLSLTLFDV